MIVHLFLMFTSILTKQLHFTTLKTLECFNCLSYQLTYVYVNVFILYEVFLNDIKNQSISIIRFTKFY